ncbi:MAG: response regulator [Thermoanaerobaculia bacterium]
MSKTILLADDSLTIQKVVELTFMEEDYEVVAVSNGDEALAQLGELTPALVIADVHMPGASGLEVCRKVKESHPGVPVLLLVGTFETFDESQVEASGADGHLKKPFDSQELLRLAERLVEGTGTQEAGGAGAPEEAAPEESEGLATVPEPETTMVMEAEEGPPKALGAEEGETEAVAEASEVPEEPLTDSSLEAAGEALELSDEDVDRIARRVVEILGDKTVREVSWDVIPDLAEIVIKDRLRDLESQVD